MFVLRIRQLVLALSMTASLTACSTTDNAGQIGTNVNAFYTAPTSYEEHRNQQQSFATSTGTIAYTDNGTGSVLVLLRYDPVDHAARTRELLAAKGITNYSLLMHDMGGLVAWEMLREDMDNIDNLVVLNTIVNDEGFEQPDVKPGPFTRTLIDAFTSPLTSVAVLTKTFADLGLRGANKLTEGECFGYVLPMREGADPALYEFFTGINDDLFIRLDENRTFFEGYQGQTLVMWGAQDETLTVEQIPILKDMLSVPYENIHIYQDNAHFLAEEIPTEVVEKVTAFIAP